MLRVMLDTHLEKTVKKAASRHGQTMSDYVRDSLTQKLLTVHDAAPLAPSEMFDKAILMMKESLEMFTAATGANLDPVTRAIIDSMGKGKA